MRTVSIDELRRRLDDCVEGGKEGLRLDDPYKFDQLVDAAEEVWSEMETSGGRTQDLELRFRGAVGTLTVL